MFRDSASAEAHGSLPLPSLNQGHEPTLQILIKRDVDPGFSMDCLWDRKASYLRALCLQFLMDQVRDIMILLLRAVLESGGRDAWGALRTVPNTLASQLQQQCHQVLLCSGESSCALQEAEHPWPLPIRCQ